MNTLGGLVNEFISKNIEAFQKELTNIPPHLDFQIELTNIESFEMTKISFLNFIQRNKNKIEKLNLKSQTEISKDWFIHLPNIKELNLSGCFQLNLQEVETICQYFENSLESLQLDHMKFDNIQQITEISLPRKLKFLSLQMTTFDAKETLNIQNLDEYQDLLALNLSGFLLSHETLESISRTMFLIKLSIELSNLQELSLSDCKLTNENVEFLLISFKFL
jgi:uncharacterized protein YjbI with pentapeptide repeats